MNEDVKKLIEELRAEGAGGVVDRLTNRAADALESAYTPVEGVREKLIEKWIKREDGLRESADRYAGYFGGQFAEVQRCRAEFEAAFPTLGREAE